MGRGSVAASSAAGLAGALGGDEGPLLTVDRNKEERARKVWLVFDAFCVAKRALACRRQHKQEFS
jgi:hypothetical protein